MDNYSNFNKSTYTYIPLLQRDYVQGDNRNAEKRDKFLNAIFKSLAGLKDSDGEPYSGQMDFIYGSSVSKSNKDGSRCGFMPIDGQQRLTTLALIGWLLAQKSSLTDYLMPELKYRTRHTTEQFCNHLMTYKLPKDYIDIRSHLKTEPIWMAERWFSDPSVKAMIDLLVAADEILKKEVFASKIDEMAQKFFNDSPLTFDILDMEEYNLSEDLYIKMNARGKHLSEFENWKAEFTAMLDHCYKDEKYTFTQVEGETFSIPEYFSYAIEHEWTNLFWPAAFNEWDKLDEKEKDKRAYPRIDEQFMRILDYVTKALFYSQYPASAEYSEIPSSAETGKADWTNRFAGKDNEWLTARRIDVYRLHKNAAGQFNVVTLFKILDTLCVIDNKFGGNWDKFFSDLIYSGDWDSQSDKVNIFDGKGADINIFKRCLEGKWNISLEFLLWGILNYCLKYRDEISGGNLRDYTRVLWGWVLTNRQRLTQGHLSVESEVRVEYYPEIDIVIEALTTDADAYMALENLKRWNDDPESQHNRLDEYKRKEEAYRALKSELERMSYRNDKSAKMLDCLMGCEYLKGDYSNIYPALKTSDPNVLLGQFIKFYNMDDWEKTKTLISHQWIGCRHYPRYPFYGKDGHWDYVFSSKERNTTDAITSYLIKDPQAHPSKKSMEYYIYKYKAFFNAGRGDERSHLYYAPGDFDVTVLLSTLTFRLPVYQMCPYATTVAKEFFENNSEISTKLNLINSEERSDHGCLRLNKGKYWIECVNEGWRFNFSDGTRWHTKWQQRFAADEQGLWKDADGEFCFKLDGDGYNVLLDDADRDRIEQCVAFITALYDLIKMD